VTDAQELADHLGSGDVTGWSLDDLAELDGAHPG
jgi:hypothetical protein